MTVKINLLGGKIRKNAAFGAETAPENVRRYDELIPHPPKNITTHGKAIILPEDSGIARKGGVNWQY